MAGWDDELFAGALQTTALPRDGCCPERPGPAVADGAAAPPTPGAGGSRLQSSAPAAGSSSQQSTPPTRKRRKAAASACVEGSGQKAPRADSKRLAPTPSVAWNAVSGSSKWRDIGSVFIESDKAVVNGEAQRSDKEPPCAVPLWPQYTMTFRGVPVPDSTWIRVSKTERWLRMMADCMTNANVRDVLKGVTQKLSRGLSCDRTVRWHRPLSRSHLRQKPSLVQGGMRCARRCRPHASLHHVLRTCARTTYVRQLFQSTPALHRCSPAPACQLLPLLLLLPRDAKSCPSSWGAFSEGSTPEGRYSRMWCRRPAVRGKRPRLRPRTSLTVVVRPPAPRGEALRGSNATCHCRW